MKPVLIGSGFVRATYPAYLARRADQQAASTQVIDKKELQPGDLVFNTMRRTFSHVGIYVGDGKFIHSPAVARKCAWKTCAKATGSAALMAPAGSRPRLASRSARWTTSDKQLQAACGPPRFRAVSVVAKWALYA